MSSLRGTRLGWLSWLAVGLVCQLVVAIRPASGDSTIVLEERSQEYEEALQALAKTPPDAAFFEALFDDSRDFESTRLEGASRGAVVSIVVLCAAEESKEPTVSFEETKRATRIETDLKTLAKLISAVSDQQAGGDVEAYEYRYLLRYKRATLKVTASMVEAEVVDEAEVRDEVLAQARPHNIVVLDLRSPSKSAENVEKLEASVLTGPTERWSLSALVPLNAANQLKYSGDTDSLEPKEEPGRFYVSLDFSLGDVLRDRPSFARAMSIKLLAAAEKKPQDSFGVGVGIAPGYFGSVHPSLEFLDTFSPWVGYTFSREDEFAEDGTVRTDKGRNSEFRWGVSLNLSKALEWLKKDK